MSTFKIGDRFAFNVRMPQRNPNARWKTVTHEYVIVDVVEEGYVACNRSASYEITTFLRSDEDRMFRI